VDPLGGWTVTIGDTAREGLPPPPVTARRRCLLRILRDLDHHVACEVQGAERRDLHGRDGRGNLFATARVFGKSPTLTSAHAAPKLAVRPIAAALAAAVPRPTS